MLPAVWRRWRNATGSVKEVEKCYRQCEGGGEMLPAVWRRRRHATGCMEGAAKCYRLCGGGGEMLPAVWRNVTGHVEKCYRQC